MVSVYLDQAKWIDLGRAFHARRGGDRFRKALDVARHTVAMGLVEFPLSVGHYVETWRATDPDRRRRLAEVMIELSQGRTLARPPDLCDSELDRLLADMADSELPRAAWPPLGWGFAHASGLHPHLPRQAINPSIELQHLRRRPDGFDGHGHGHRDFGDLYRDAEAGMAAGRQQRPLTAATTEAVLAVTAVIEIWENIEWAIERAGLPRDALGPISRVRPDVPAGNGGQVLNDALPYARGFIERLPTRDAALRLRIERHRNLSNKWESNDLIDIAYLACAVVHCEIVVTEKQWVHELDRSGLLALHNTVALHDVAVLPQTLAERTG